MAFRPAASTPGKPKKKIIDGPRYDLETEVRKLAPKAIIRKKRAKDRVAAHLDTSEREAESYIRKELAKLDSKQYVETWEMSDEWNPPGIVLDIYLYANDDTCWYVKFGIYQSRIDVVSFHKEGEYPDDL